MKLDAQGGLTIYIQHDAPSADHESNCGLPTERFSCSSAAIGRSQPSSMVRGRRPQSSLSSSWMSCESLRHGPCCGSSPKQFRRWLRSQVKPLKAADGLPSMQPRLTSRRATTGPRQCGVRRRSPPVSQRIRVGRIQRVHQPDSPPEGGVSDNGNR